MSTTTSEWRQFICRACGLIYDEQTGDPDSGLAPGTRFEDIPEDWECPLCGVIKADFEPYSALQGDLTDCPPIGASSHSAGVVVVGAGHAGWAVIEAIRSLDGTIPITLVSACAADRYHKPELSIAMSRGSTQDSLIRESAAAAASRLGVRLMRHTFVTGMSPSLHQLRTTRGTLQYTRLVLAQGARPALPQALPATMCWRVNDIAGWNGLQRKLAGTSKRVLIIGAGMVGCELAEDFAHVGHQVTLLDLQTQPLAMLLPEPAAARLSQSFLALGISFIGGVEVANISALEDGTRRVVSKCGQTWDADEIVAATGLATESRIVRAAGLAFDRGIVVDASSLRTSVDDVYALGDCISIAGAPCRFIEPIARQATTIAQQVLDRPHQAYTHAPPLIRLKTRSLPIVVHGQPNTTREWQIVEETEHYLRMQQSLDGKTLALLEVGTPTNRMAA